MRRLVRIALRLALAFAMGSAALVLLYRFVDPPLTPLMLSRAIGGAIEGRPLGIDQQWADLDAIHPALVRAVLAGEDMRFFAHHGFDLIELERAWRSNQRPGARLRGASTISMQCARNVFLWQGRTWPRKALEAWFTALLEIGWSKRRILEVYLNVVEWGPGVYGAEAAARHWFGVAAARVDARQAALLAAALPAPLRSTPSAPSRSLQARAARIRARMAQVDLGPLAAARVPSRGPASPGLDRERAAVVASSSGSRGLREGG